MKIRKKLKHGLYRLLNRSGLRPSLALLATTIATVRAEKVCRVSYDGEWVQKFPSRTLVEPRLTLWTPERIERLTRDLFMYQYLPKGGDTIVDVGAGTGWETYTFSKLVGRSGRVISIEAHPAVFRCLSRVCAENRLENVTPIHAAVADREGEVLLSDSPEHEANGIMGAVSGLRVPCTTLDHIFLSLGLSRVDFLKMNIEGAERLALPGMREMAGKTRNVCISCHDFLADGGGSSELRTKSDVIAFLKQNRFLISLRESDGRCNVRDYVYGLNQSLPTNHILTTYAARTPAQG